MQRTLFTIGYANRTLEEFLTLLNQHGITALCDVRSTPYSSRHPDYNRELLQKTLKSHGIDYLFLGDELGARSTDPACYVDGKATYGNIARSPLFKAGLERIRLGMEKNFVIALMCAEKDPLTCHRAILICRHLREKDFAIQHIIDSTTSETQSALESRMIKVLKLYPDLFLDADPSSLIERAYDLQGDRIAYVEQDGKERDVAAAELVREDHEHY